MAVKDGVIDISAFYFPANTHNRVKINSAMLSPQKWHNIIIHIKHSSTQLNFVVSQAILQPLSVEAKFGNIRTFLNFNFIITAVTFILFYFFVYSFPFHAV
jgi:hypothetical protein